MTDEQWAEQLARTRLTDVAGEQAIAQARVEVQPTAGGWHVVFSDTQASCAFGGNWWDGVCQSGAAPGPDGAGLCWPVYQAVWANVEHGMNGWTIRQFGAYPNGSVTCRAVD
ncbi:MAG TPA: hypothetical protein VK066_15950 [Chloroflexota bacterium]|nr:hypothetical protein [Chloroflexota bacterium]